MLIDPEHVVSVPKDHYHQKLRACEVLPVAVYQGGEYKKGLAVESTETEKVTEKVEVPSNTKSVEVATASTSSSNTRAVSAYLINNIPYSFGIITDSLFRNFNGDNPEFDLSRIVEKVRYRASKAPAAIKRYATEHELSVYEAYRFIYAEHTYYVAIFQEEDDRRYCYILSPVIEGIDTFAKIKQYLEGPVVVKEEVKKNPLTTSKLIQIGEVVYCNDTYIVGEMQERIGSVPEYVENDIAGFVRSLTSIKPSKMPIGLKNLLGSFTSKPIAKFYRIVLNDDSLCFIVDYSSLMVLMRLK